MAIGQAGLTKARQPDPVTPEQKVLILSSRPQCLSQCVTRH